MARARTARFARAWASPTRGRESSSSMALPRSSSWASRRTADSVRRSAYLCIWRRVMRVLIVDDEPLARERIRLLLADEPDMEIAGECPDGATAVEAIAALRPELVFLDVQMREVNGFQVIERLDATAVRVIVFVTAFDQYAIHAFDVCALDYLLKPFDRERFEQALARARIEHRRRSEGELDARLRSVLEQYHGAKRYLDRFVIRAGGRVIFLPVEELDW